jgi:hypothetical protein
VAVTNEPTEQDRDRELGRSFRRAVFDQQQWEEHRSAKRYARHFFGILTSRIVRGLLGPCVYVGSLCFSVCTYHTLLDMHALQWLAPDVRAAPTARHSHAPPHCVLCCFTSHAYPACCVGCRSM